MDREELIIKLEQTEIPEFKLASHRSQLRTALLADASFNERPEGSMEYSKSRTGHIFDFVGLISRRPLWKAAFVTAITVLLIAAAVFTIPSVGSRLASLFSGGTVAVGGRQLTMEQKEQALAILKSDPRIEELIRQGATIPTEYILSLEVTMSGTDSETGKTVTTTETWAEARIQLADRAYTAQVDLVRGSVVSISEN